MKNNNIILPSVVALTVAVLLSIIQLMTDSSLIILERFFIGGAWIEIVVISLYSWFVSYKMSDPLSRPKWRLYTWSVFAFVFFSQLILGILVDERFLASGKLHLPIPMMIAAGPFYRLEISFMPILFISTIILSGPAWCSQLCYFGAFDAMAANRRKKGKYSAVAWLKPVKYVIPVMVIFTAILLRLFAVPVLWTTIIAALFGVFGLAVIVFYSPIKGKMMHCSVYCPIGTIVNYAKYINPFRFRISDSCTSCMRCIPECKYGALDKEAIENRKPGINCTLCGDCISVCKPESLHYSFPGLSNRSAANLYLAISIILHSLFLALARI